MPVAEKKGTKGKEKAEASTSQKSSSLAENTRKESQRSHPTESAMIIKKHRKKETIPRALVLGNEHEEGKNEKA